MARFTFFIGKGGVGKTTISSAYAINRAARQPRRKILLLSTDPAHSLGSILQLKVGDRPKRLPAAGQLWCRQLDAERQIKSFLKREREELLSLLGQGSLLTRDELEPLLDTSLPGMAEVGALLAIDQLLAGDFDEIVIDTAPMGHAIRLFQMPAHFAKFLEVLEIAASRDVVLASHFGGRVRREPGLERWSAMVDRLQRVLQEQGSKPVLVTTPEPFSLKQALRSAESFAEQRISEVVLNRVVERPGECPRCTRQTAEARRARAFLGRHFGEATLFVGEDPGCPLMGIPALRAFGAHVFDGKGLPRGFAKPPRQPVESRFKPAAWPKLDVPLTLTLGKGGVGKTTVSAALAVRQRMAASKESVVVCSIDPAPSLDDVFAAKVGDTPRAVLGDSKLRAAELDAMTEFQDWATRLAAEFDEHLSDERRGVHVDLSLDRRFLRALLEVVPPGVDEIFAIFRILDLLKDNQRVVIDMAPTGHALEVLRMPERLLAWSRVLLKTLAAHRTLRIARDVGVEVATLSQRVRELAALLRDAAGSQLLAVTLPEPLPDFETGVLLRELATLKNPASAILVNRVLMSGHTGCRRCTLKRQWQAVSLARLRKEAHGIAIYVAPEFDRPIAVAVQLRRFTRTLWQPA